MHKKVVKSSYRLTDGLKAESESIRIEISNKVHVNMGQGQVVRAFLLVCLHNPKYRSMVINGIVKWIKKNGVFSLVFYNKHAILELATLLTRGAIC